MAETDYYQIFGTRNIVRAEKNPAPDYVYKYPSKVIEDTQEAVPFEVPELKDIPPGKFFTGTNKKAIILPAQ